MVNWGRTIPGSLPAFSSDEHDRLEGMFNRKIIHICSVCHMQRKKINEPAPRQESFRPYRSPAKQRQLPLHPFEALPAK